MYISYWDTNDFESKFFDKQLADKNEKVLTGALLEIVKPELSTIEIETINRCNNDCSFCPANRNLDIRKTHRMDEALFKKIIDELAEMDYRGRVSLFSNDEPLLDNRILDFLIYARKKLPYAYHSMFTNGILLNEENYSVLLDNLDYLRINNYNDDMKLNNNIVELLNKSIDEKNCLVEVEVRRKTQVLQNRGGLSPNNNDKMNFNSPCILPFVQMVIRPDGLVSRCCQDVYGNETLGDLKQNTIKEIFYGEKYMNYRKAMLEDNRCSLEYCNSCDVYGLVNRYPAEWEYSYYQALSDFVAKKAKTQRAISLCCIEDTDRLSTDLLMRGIKNFNISFVQEDMAHFLKRGDFIVWGGDIEYIRNLAEEYKKNIEEDYILCSKTISGYARFDFNHNRQNERNEIWDAEKEGRLVIFGAGYTAKKIVDGLQLTNYHIVDNKKCGELFGNTVQIGTVQSIKDIVNPFILIATFRPVDAIAQLNGMGISSRDIRMVYQYLR